MKKTHNIFWKIFSAIMVAFTGTGTAVVAEETMVIPLCNENKYLSRCGDPNKNTENVIGTKWLKGYYKESSGTYTDNFDYYDSPSTYRNENLRKFFGNCTGDNCKLKNKKSTLEDQWEDQGTIAANRNAMLTEYCDPNNVYCEPCPHGGTVGASEVIVNKTTHKPIDWKIRTVADCAVSEYQDATGTYSYYDDDSAITSTDCYYFTNKPGTGFKYYYS